MTAQILQFPERGGTRQLAVPLGTAAGGTDLSPLPAWAVPGMPVRVKSSGNAGWLESVVIDRRNRYSLMVRCPSGCICAALDNVEPEPAAMAEGGR